MPPPLADDQVSYAQNADENPATTVPQRSISTPRTCPRSCLGAEPHMVEPRAWAWWSFCFLIILAGLVYYTKKKVWAYTPGVA
jgi:hypothetical protein